MVSFLAGLPWAAAPPVSPESRNSPPVSQTVSIPASTSSRGNKVWMLTIPCKYPPHLPMK